MFRVVVSSGCTVRCPSCVACPGPGREPPAAEVLGDPATELVLGGGDATQYSHLVAVLEQNRESVRPKRLWLEAPAGALSDAVLERLANQGLFGVIVQIEAKGEAMCRALGVGDGEHVIERAEDLGLRTQARLCVRPKTFPIVTPLARNLAPRPVALELVRQDWGKHPLPIPVAAIEQLLRAYPNLRWSPERMNGHGYLPPCVLPTVWRDRPDLWRQTLRERREPQQILSACRTCALRTTCSWNDVGALDSDASANAIPVAAAPWRGHSQAAVPEVLIRKRRGPEVICVTPWTTMEIVDPDGRTRQCCSTWTVGDRGNAHSATLTEIWNGEGYRRARQIMSGGSTSDLCNPICSRLYDRKFSETTLRIQSGSEPFVQNQLLLAEDIAERREIVRGRPLRLAVCTSTYCNYDCIMCDYGRTPRRELPERIFSEILELLPTLQSLTLLGGEPLANPRTMRFLREFDVARTPDVAVDFVTNGSLLTAPVLKQMTKCTLGDITISLNAGTAAAYAQIQRGIAFQDVLRNLDDLIAFRSRHHRWFGITLSFVLQPAAAHTLMDFAAIAHDRNLRIRLMALNVENHVGLDFYMDGDVVADVIRHVDDLRAFCVRHRPEWLAEVDAGRSAILEEAARRKREVELRSQGIRRLPLVPTNTVVPAVLLLDLYARPDAFLADDSAVQALRALQAAKVASRLVRAFGVAPGDDSLAQELAKERSPMLVALPRAWSADLVSWLRASLPPGSQVVRLSKDGTPTAMDSTFDRVVDHTGLLSLALGGDPKTPAFRPATKAELREGQSRPRSADESTIVGVTVLGHAPRPAITGPATGCPYLKDARQSQLFADLRPTEPVQFKGCTFCLDQTGAYAAPTEEQVLTSWLRQLRAIRARDPGVREVLLTDERPHPFLPAFFRALLDDPTLGGIELLVKSRVDWLLEYGETHLAPAAKLASDTRSVLHVYLVGFENFDRFHLELFNKGQTPEESERAIALLRSLSSRFPASFEFRRLRAHGVVLFTPWTSPEALVENARWMRKVGFSELRAEALRTRLRLYPRTPLHALAQRDGLLTARFEQGRPDRAGEQGYDASVPWRFRDERTEAVFRAATALAADGSVEEPDALEGAARLLLSYPGLSAVPDLAKLPIAATAQAWPTPGALGLDLEIEGIRNGVKLAALKENVPAGDASGLVAAYKAMGFAADVASTHDRERRTGDHRAGQSHAIVAVARDEATLTDLMAYQRAQSERGSGGAIEALGRLMGYPTCCVQAFAAQRSRNDNFENERLTFLRRPDEALHPLLMRLGSVRLTSHHLCSPGCRASVDLARHNLEILRGMSADLASEVERRLREPMLFLAHDRAIRLKGAWSDDGFRVESAAGEAPRFGAPLEGLAWIHVSPDEARLTYADGATRVLTAVRPLLVCPGEALHPLALAAIRLTRPASLLPPSFRAGVRIGDYRIWAVRTNGSQHTVALERFGDSFTVRLSPASPDSVGVCAGDYCIESDDGALSGPRGAAVGMIARVLAARGATRHRAS